MSDRPDINAIFDRIANRNATDGDIQTLRQSVAIGGNAQGATIVTGDDNIIGDNNTVQIGNENINLAGSNIKFGDTIYQGADAEMIRVILRKELANKTVIDTTFSRLFGKSESSGVDWDWGMKLLKQKQLPEIRKRLTDTLGRDRILIDVSIEERQNWVNRSPLAADRTLQINGENCGTLDANKMLIETFGRDDIEGKLLILGAPGAGKTTALLSLAEQLVYGAISQPKTVIPVIFELSTWQNDNQSIQSWLIEQLYDLHGGNRKSKLYEQWLERQVLLPLLDGLDELGLERQKKCTEKLNEFAEHYPQLVVCCRIKEFEAVDIKLRNLRGAVCLQSLSDSQIQHYLDTLKRPELWGAIQTTRSLQAMLETTTEGDPGLLRVPLFVKLVADVYDPQQPISNKTDLLDKYIDRQLSFDQSEIDRRKELREYKWAYKTVKQEPDWKKTYYTLSWIARNLQTDNKVEFLIEHMQPSLIAFTKSQYYYRLIFGLFFGLSAGLINVFVNVVSENNVNLFAVLYRALMYMCFFGISFGLILQTNNRLINGLMGGLIGIPIGGIFFGLLWPKRIGGILYYGGLSGLIGGLVFGLIGGMSNIELLESFELSKSNILRKQKHKILNVMSRQGLKYGFFIGLISGLTFSLSMALDGQDFAPNISSEIIYIWLIRNLGEPITKVILVTLIGIVFSICGLIPGLVLGVIYGLIDVIKQELKLHSRPNQGIWSSLQSQFLITMLIFIFTMSIFVPFAWLQNWKVALFIALILGFAVGGGKACLQHLSLRIILWQSGLPWNFARFLNYCVERRLLLRVGGSYRFLHRELLDHFARSSR